MLHDSPYCRTSLRQYFQRRFYRSEKKVLMQQSVIETFNDEVKNMAQVEHSRQRSFKNFIGASFPPLTYVLSKTGNLVCFELYPNHVIISLIIHLFVTHCQSPSSSDILFCESLPESLLSTRGTSRWQKKVFSGDS